MELDIYDEMPRDMKAYLKHYGWNFSKKAFEFAVSMMTSKRGRIEKKNKEDVMELLQRNNVKLENNVGYNAMYVFHMALSDFYGSSISDEVHLAKYVKDVIDDEDNKGGNVMRKWYTDMVAKGVPVEWYELL